MYKPELNLWWEAREPAQADDARKFAQFVNGLPELRLALSELAGVAEN